MRLCLCAVSSLLANGLVVPPHKKRFEVVQNHVMYVADPQPIDLDSEFAKLDRRKWTTMEYDKGGPDYMWIKPLREYPQVRVAVYPTTWAANGRKIDMVSQKISRKHGYDREVVNALCRAFKAHLQGDFLDVGGNIGAYTLPLASCLQQTGSDRKVVTVELSPENAHHLVVGLFVSKHISNLTNVHLYNYGVSDAILQNQIAIVTNSKNQGMTRADEDLTVDDTRTHAQVTTLDSIMKRESNAGLLAMKIDIEGHEAKAFRGFQEFMSKSPPCILVAELNHSGQELQDEIEKAGFVYKWSAKDGMNSWYEQADMEGCLAKLNVP